MYSFYILFNAHPLRNTFEVSKDSSLFLNVSFTAILIYKWHQLGVKDTLQSVVETHLTWTLLQQFSTVTTPPTLLIFTDTY